MMPSKKRARSIEDKKAQFNRILKAGEELLQENHGRVFSLRELAHRLDMAPSNLYNYVKNENELRVAILHSHFNMSSESLEQLTEVQEKTYLKMLEALNKHFFESYSEHRWVATELMRLQSLDGEHSVNLEMMIKPYKHLIERAVDTGELPRQDIEFAAMYVWSLLQGSANMLRLAESSTLFDEARTKDYIEYVSNVIISSLKSMPAS